LSFKKERPEKFTNNRSKNLLVRASCDERQLLQQTGTHLGLLQLELRLTVGTLCVVLDRGTCFAFLYRRLVILAVLGCDHAMVCSPALLAYSLLLPSGSRVEVTK
jgi:hypothetical protein